MKIKKVNLGLEIFFFELILISAVFARNNIPNIIPQPQKHEYNNQIFSINNSKIGVINYCENNQPLNVAVAELIDVISNNSGAQINEQINSEKNIFIGLPSNSLKFKRLLTKTNLFPTGEIGEEGYNLLVDSLKIIVTANKPEGLFYGVQTLKQMFRGSSENSLAGIKIIDWPDYKYRAVSDDISRGPIPTLDFMKYQIRRFSEMKINTLIHYVEHVVKTESHPEFAPEDGSLTIDEWKEISSYGKKYNITVIGGFQSFGHFARILETEEYKHLGESGTLISPMLDESYEFLEDIYLEMIPAFDSPFFNINCDETFDLGKEESKELVDSIGYDGVYYQHIMKLYNIVKKFNKRVIMWGDILLEYPDLLKKLPKDIIIGTWTYDPKEDFSDYILPIKEAGFEFWVVPGILNSYRLFPNYHNAPTNIKNFSADGQLYGASGLLNCVWDDGGSTLFSNSWYGVAYGADKSWNTKSSDGENFNYRFNIGIYGAANDAVTETIFKLIELAYLEPTDGMLDKILFSKTLPEEGEATRLSVEQWERVGDILNDAEQILMNAEVKSFTNDLEYLKYTINLYKTLLVERNNLLRSAELYAQAESKFDDFPFEARKTILKSYSLIAEIIERFINLRDKFSQLWLAENHTYALNWTTDKYDEKIKEYDDVKNRIFTSLKKIDSSLGMLPKESVRLAITKLPGKYFREWMMVNPIIKDEKGSLANIDYLERMGGEATAVPKVTQEFYYNDIKYRWRRVVTEYPDFVKLDEIYPDENKEVVMYAFANISVENDINVEALVGSDEGIEIFINGTSIYRVEGDNYFELDKYSVSLPLKKGKNNVLLKITQTTGEWSFSFRLPNCDVRNSKNRYRIVK